MSVSRATGRSAARAAEDSARAQRQATNGKSRSALITRSNTGEPRKARLLQYEERAARVLAQRREALHHRVVEGPDAAGEALLQRLRQYEVERHQRDREELALLVLELREDLRAQLPVLHRQRVLVGRACRRCERTAEPQQRVVPERLEGDRGPPRAQRPGGLSPRWIALSAWRSWRWCRIESPTITSNESSGNDMWCASSTRKRQRSATPSSCTRSRARSISASDTSIPVTLIAPSSIRCFAR